VYIMKRRGPRTEP